MSGKALRSSGGTPVWYWKWQDGKERRRRAALAKKARGLEAKQRHENRTRADTGQMLLATTRLSGTRIAQILDALFPE